MYLLEHDQRGSGLDDLAGALFWVSAQLTTVSSQMPNSVMTPGRVLDIVLEVEHMEANAAGVTGAPRRPASGVIGVSS